MNQQYKMILRTMIGIAAVGALGCGQGFKTGNEKAATSAQAVANVDDQMAKADQAAKDAATAMSEAQAAIDQISDSKGNININLFTKNSAAAKASGLLAPLISKLEPLFNKVYDKVALVKGQFDVARAALAEALGKLDQNDPAQAALVAKVNAQIARIDMMETQFRDKIHVLAGKLTLAITGLDKIVSGVTSFIPGFGWLASWALDMLVMNDVKQLILDLQAKLLAI